MASLRSSTNVPSLPAPSTNLDDLAAEELSLALPQFTADDAWNLGSALRNALRNGSVQPAVINISGANSHQQLFHACTRPGTHPDNDHWVSMKRNTVLRWGHSTWYMHNKFGGERFKFREKYMLGEKAGDYAIHGGGYPIYVKGVEGVVAVVVVSGLKQEQDHQIVVECLRGYQGTFFKAGNGGGSGEISA